VTRVAAGQVLVGHFDKALQLLGSSSSVTLEEEEDVRSLVRRGGEPPPNRAWTESISVVRARSGRLLLLRLGACTSGARGGLSARALVLAQEDYLALGANPFSLLQAFAPPQTPEPEDLEDTLLLPPVGPGMLEPGSVDFAELSRLLDSAARGRALLLKCEQDQRALFSELLACLPARLRSEVTFSTWRFCSSHRLSVQLWAVPPERCDFPADGRPTNRLGPTDLPTSALSSRLEDLLNGEAPFGKPTQKEQRRRVRFLISQWAAFGDTYLDDHLSCYELETESDPWRPLEALLGRRSAEPLLPDSQTVTLVAVRRTLVESKPLWPLGSVLAKTCSDEQLQDVAKGLRDLALQLDPSEALSLKIVLLQLGLAPPGSKTAEEVFSQPDEAFQHGGLVRALEAVVSLHEKRPTLEAGEAFVWKVSALHSTRGSVGALASRALRLDSTQRKATKLKEKQLEEGRACLRREEPLRALRKFKRARHLAPSCPHTLLSLGQTRRVLGNLTEAQRVLNQAVEVATREGNPELAASCRLEEAKAICSELGKLRRTPEVQEDALGHCRKLEASLADFYQILPKKNREADKEVDAICDEAREVCEGLISASDLPVTARLKELLRRLGSQNLGPQEPERKHARESTFAALPFGRTVARAKGWAGRRSANTPRISVVRALLSFVLYVLAPGLLIVLIGAAVKHFATESVPDASREKSAPMADEPEESLNTSNSDPGN
jgi:tetratricopeptide (TPR) repeat protein